MEFLDLTTIITIAVAVFVLLRLRAVLGQRTGHQEPPDYLEGLNRRKSDQSEETSGDNVVKLPNRQPAGSQQAVDPVIEEINEIASPRTKLNKALKAVRENDPTFQPKSFLSGASSAYEMIVSAFAAGDSKALRDLLSPEVFEGFNSVINERRERGETVKTAFVGLDSAEIKSAEMKENESHVTVRFVSQIISAVLSSDGKVLEGDENEIATVTDIWTFSRDVRSRDPNWKLVATEAES